MFGNCIKLQVAKTDVSYYLLWKLNQTQPTKIYLDVSVSIEGQGYRKLISIRLPDQYISCFVIILVFSSMFYQPKVYV